MIQPFVSICCITYNQESFIAQAIEGFLIQKTTFPIEIIIHDDASTDSTQQILKQYAEKYPELIKTIFQTENQFSKGKGNILGNFVFSLTRGKYIAICEGDDYWSDPFKLQKQVDFLEGNPDCSTCFHAANFLNENELTESHVKRPNKIPKNSKFHIKDVILGGGGFMTTNSLVFRKVHIQNLPEWFYKAPIGDLPLMLVLANRGEIGYIDEIMSVYRVMAPGSWTCLMSTSKQKRCRHHKAILQMFNDFNKWSNYQYSTYIILKKLKNIILHQLYD